MDAPRRTHSHALAENVQMYVCITKRAPVARSIAARERQNGGDAKVDARTVARARAREHSPHFRALLSLERERAQDVPDFCLFCWNWFNDAQVVRTLDDEQGDVDYCG